MRKIGFALLAYGAVALLFAAPAYDPAIFGSLDWRGIGPPRGGRSIAPAGSSSRPMEYYFGASGGGLTWHPVADGQLKSTSLCAVSVSESNRDVVYRGMGELRGNIMQGDGDGRPNASSYTVFKELSDQVAAQKARLDALLKSDLPGVNKLLPVGQALSPANPLGAHQ